MAEIIFGTLIAGVGLSGSVLILLPVNDEIGLCIGRKNRRLFLQACETNNLEYIKELFEKENISMKKQKRPIWFIPCHVSNKFSMLNQGYALTPGLKHAVENGNLEVYKYIVEYLQHYVVTDLLTTAMLGNHVHLIKYMCETHMCFPSFEVKEPPGHIIVNINPTVVNKATLLQNFCKQAIQYDKTDVAKYLLTLPELQNYRDIYPHLV